MGKQGYIEPVIKRALQDATMRGRYIIWVMRATSFVGMAIILRLAMDANQAESVLMIKFLAVAYLVRCFYGKRNYY